MMKIIAQLGQKLTDKDLGALLDALNHTALVSMTDAKGDITYANEKFVEVSQYALDELLGRNHRILKSGDQPDALFDDLWRTIAGGRVWRGEIRNRAKDGSFYWVDTAIAPILNHNGKPERYISVRFLITDRKREELAKSQFVSLASHQLRTPLSAVRWALSGLRMRIGERLDDSAREDLEGAERAAVAMAETIETLLLLSQLQAGKVAPDVSRIRLVAFFDAVARDFRRQYGSRRQRLVRECPPDLSVRTDGRLFREILHNLVSNAIKYAPDGSEIRLRAMPRDDGIRIEVEDAGMGIPASEQGRVFSMFFRAENVVDAEIAGTGLGLHLARSLARLLKGDISFVSREGKGTTFALLLPSS
jgi:PAS domain S-box-containing protein